MMGVQGTLWRGLRPLSSWYTTTSSPTRDDTIPIVVLSYTNGYTYSDAYDICFVPSNTLGSVIGPSIGATSERA